MSARDRALAEAADQVLAGISDVAGLCARLETIGGCGRLVSAIRARISAPSPVAGRPDAGVWAAAADRLVRR